MTNIPAFLMASLGTRILTLLLTTLAALPITGQQLREGDLLFCCSETANAITSVTTGQQDLPIDHVAIVHYIGGEQLGLPYVIEAVKPAVCLTPLDTFLCENGRVLQGRVNADCDIAASIKRCLMLVGKPYDDLYLQGDSAVYCSELVQMCFIDPSGKLVFDLVPMSFHDATGQVTDYWQEFYQARGMKVPEGEPGSNPGELSRREQVTILGWYNE